MTTGPFGNLRGGLRSVRLRRSIRHLRNLIVKIPREVPGERDLTWLELRRIIPAILAQCHRPELPASLSGVPGEVPSNLAVMQGLLVSLDSPVHGVREETILARAVCSLRFPSVVPSDARRELLRACEKVEWTSAPADLALAASQKAFRLKRSIPLWRRVLGEFARAERWNDICSKARRHPVLSLLARKELHRERTTLSDERILAAELIALARCYAGNSDRQVARHWLLPLVTRSTGRYMERTFAARRLCEQLVGPCHVSPIELAEAIERGITPKGNGDYSNFRDAFSPVTWERLHGAFRNWAIFTELERFACEHDRARFWRYITSKGPIG